jgi:hypothetical protein
MTSTTDFYMALQRVYQDKSTADAEAVHGHVRVALRGAGRPEAGAYARSHFSSTYALSVG